MTETRPPPDGRPEAVVQTRRLRLRRLELDDAAFMLELLNEPSFLRFIGDKGVRTLDDAREHIRTGPMASYRTHGFGIYLAERRTDATPVGICGLLKRDSLADVDVGFALRPEFWRQGLASEAAQAVVEYGHRVLGIGRIVAVTTPDNAGSIRVLEKLGLRPGGTTRLAPDGVELLLYVPGETPPPDAARR